MMYIASSAIIIPDAPTVGVGCAEQKEVMSAAE